MQSGEPIRLLMSMWADGSGLGVIPGRSNLYCFFPLFVISVYVYVYVYVHMYMYMYMYI